MNARHTLTLAAGLVLAHRATTYRRQLAQAERDLEVKTERVEDLERELILQARTAQTVQASNTELHTLMIENDELRDENRRLLRLSYYTTGGPQ